MDIDDQFFGDTPAQQPNNQQQFEVPQQNNREQDEFQFTNEQQEYQIPQYSNINNYASMEEENETAKKIREEQEKIMEQLRQKANQEYENKQKRKQQGQQQLDEFIQQKEAQVSRRKQQNIQKQKKLKQEMKQQTVEAGWKKVAGNIKIKQGEQVGKKDVNRMREAILHKRDDPKLQ